MGSYMAPFIIMKQKARMDSELYLNCNSIPSNSPEFTSMCDTDFIQGFIPQDAGKQDASPEIPIEYAQPAGQSTP